MCEGGTPEAFYRRKRERARARKQKELEKARRAVALVAQIRARNAAAISAARNSHSSGVGGEDRNSTAATTVQGALGSPSPAEADEVGEAADEGGDVEAATVVAVAVAGGREEGGGAGGATSRGTGGGAVPAGSVGAAASAAFSPAPALVDFSPSGSDARTKLDSESSASNVDVDAAREALESAINKPDGDRDEDVRRYEQGFRGLSSAYGAYSRVFDSQVFLLSGALLAAQVK